MFITKRKHEAALALMAKANVDLEQELKTERETVGRLINRNRAFKAALTEANAEAAANAADAAKYRRSRANLKQFKAKVA